MYTMEQLDQIDQAVAENFMHWELAYFDGIIKEGDAYLDKRNQFKHWAKAWHPTRDRAQAVMVFEQCAGMHLMGTKSFDKDALGAYECVYWPDNFKGIRVGADTPMLAICLAALKRAGVEEPK